MTAAINPYVTSLSLNLLPYPGRRIKNKDTTPRLIRAGALLGEYVDEGLVALPYVIDVVRLG